MKSEKDAYVKKVKARLDEMREEIDKLYSKAGRAKDDAKANYEKQIDEFRRTLKELANKLADIEKASDNAWQDLKQGLEKYGETLTKSFAQAKKRVEREYQKSRKK
jgi:uncharacterized protein YukE